jgi:ATP-dependent DNA helicase RecQ
MDAKRDILQRYWGYPAYRPLQEEVIRAILAKKDLLALMPTGGGKSLCFQLPALLGEGLTLVVTPLIALMQDQVGELKRRGIAAEALHSGMNKHQIDIIVDNCVYGATKLLYLSPERLETDIFTCRLPKMNVSLLVVDEAHCIAEWGHDFRPSYSKIASIRSILPGLPIAAFTATATEAVKKEIKEKLSLRSPLVFQKSFARNNLSLHVEERDDPKEALYGALRRYPGAAIVYTAKRRDTHFLATYLASRGLSATYYHAGLSLEERERRQEAWSRDGVRVMVATNAFGMGIDKSNVRLVVHLYFPSTLEAYYQEVGRAGRDGKAAHAMLFYAPQEPANLLRKSKERYPEISLLKHIYQRLAGYYQIAIGSHAGVSYPFDIEDFVYTYKMKPLEVHLALKSLQEAALIDYNDRFAVPEKLLMRLKGSQLYLFEVSNPGYSPLIKLLNYEYCTTIFSDWTKISVQKISKALQCTPLEIERKLQGLNRLGVASYVAAQKKPIITFLTPRYGVENLPISRAKIKNRKEIMMKKAAALIAYMQNKERCRMQLLLQYFGETSDERCGRCDRCMAPEKEAKKQAATYDKGIREAIVKLLRGAPLKPEELLQAIKETVKQEEEVVVHVLREMMKEGYFAYTAELKLMLV